MTNKYNAANNSVVAPELVIVPVPGKGHLASTIEFAKHLLHHHDKLSITILVIPTYSASIPLPTITSHDVSNDRIKYIHLPRVDPTPDFNFLRQVEYYKAHVKDAIANILSRSASVRLLGLVVDMFCVCLIDVANEFHVPTYIFFTAGAGCLGFIRHIDVVRYESLGVPLLSDSSIIPCYAHPVPATALPSFIFNDDEHSTFLMISKRLLECKGIFLNTFVELESHAVMSFLLGGEFPPVYTVGPILDLTSLETKKSSTVDDKADKIMRWLDDQPSSTVVLLCFGSMGSFRDPSQLKEIALGLERSGQRFLWSVRKVTSPDAYSPPEDYTDYEEIMPEGFFERIGERGMVCGWVPQVEVLSHPAIGGFVSHCGWNSILESFWFGVPIAAWPMYAEQQLNAFQMVEELGLAVEVKLGYSMKRGDLVMANDIEKAVKCLMDGDSEVRKRTKDISEKSREVVKDGGSSYISFQLLMKDMFQNVSL